MGSQSLGSHIGRRHIWRGMADFRDFTQNCLWSGGCERYRRSVSVFPERSKEYYASKQSLQTIQSDRDFNLMFSGCMDHTARPRSSQYSCVPLGPLTSLGLGTWAAAARHDRNMHKTFCPNFSI